LADAQAMDLLRKMLEFYPPNRITAEKALDHPFFQSIRKPQLETRGHPLEGPSFLDAPKVDMELLKQEIYKEALWYRDHQC
jgi:mitogen-activated protein kinase 1/3